MRKVSLTIKNVTLKEAKELLSKVREIEQRHPEETILTVIEGLEDLSPEEVAKIIHDIFPKKGMAG